MRILIEEHKYRAEEVRSILHGVDALETVEGYVSLNYVGYFYNTELRIVYSSFRKFFWRVWREGTWCLANMTLQPY